MITFSLTADIKQGRYNEAIAWAKERAAFVSAQNCSYPLTVHVPVAGREHSVTFVQGFENLAEMEAFQSKMESMEEHLEAMAHGHNEFFVEGTVESRIYHKLA